jgi:hypothetical protein
MPTVKKVVKNKEVKEQPKAVVEKKVVKSRKDLIKDKFLKCVKENHPKDKFNRLKYLDNSGGHGILRDALGEYNAYDRKTFLGVLDDLCKEDKLYHVGSSMYVLR